MEVLAKKKKRKKAETSEPSDEVTINRNVIIAWIVATIGLFLFSIIILIICCCDRKRYKDKIIHLESSISTIEASPMVIHTVAANEVVVLKDKENKVASKESQKKPIVESKMESVVDDETRKKKKKTKTKQKKRETVTVESTQDDEKSRTLATATGRARTRTAHTATGGTTVGGNTVGKEEESDGDRSVYPIPQITTGTEGTAGTAEIQLAPKRY
ncbi:hypothetical protein GCK72_013615 [Caenorhabditis remanei]|uniref:Uncharacterized protein n=1 Tax=Caenorhabditis remanei TaxID=31234 RepID=A0A6A5GP48_CAERE|nr:hypothetical protein GCK72_013615 [Caenorhabditis remanei]KAF1757160.1 hypothetical protein GCK72_013615 [Caenorhabditis remanei]